MVRMTADDIKYTWLFKLHLVNVKYELIID